MGKPVNERVGLLTFYHLGERRRSNCSRWADNVGDGLPDRECGFSAGVLGALSGIANSHLR